jgi:monoamine oxidase
MVRPQAEHVVIIGAGAAGLMAARELARVSKRITILEARDRCGGRIESLPAAEFGYPAEGGAEFVHGEAPVTRGLLRKAGLALLPIHGTRWNVARGSFSQDELADRHSERLRRVLAELMSDMTVAEFLQQHFPGPEYSRLRRSIKRMVEGYDAADPDRASIFAVRDEWMSRGTGAQTRIVGGYGALVDFLAAECRRLGVVIHLNSIVSAIGTSRERTIVRCANGKTHAGEAAILTVPLPLLQQIALPPTVREKAAAAAADIGFGNVIKLLLRFKTRWWTSGKGSDLSDLLFLLSEETIPVWWTQHPTEHPVLTGWVAGPKTEGMAHLDESDLIETGLASLADIFGLSPKQLKRDLVAARAINWARDTFARGAYSYATLETRAAQSALARSGGAVLLSGEAFYRGRDMGTVEAALTSGLEAARTILADDRIATP